MNIATPNSEPPPAHSTSFHRTVAGLIWLATATLTYLVSLWLLKHHRDWSPALRIALTLLPLVPGIVYLRYLLKSFWQMDELQRRIQVEALGFALVGTVVVMTVTNISAAEGIRLLDYPKGFGIGAVYMTMFVLWSIGISISSFRYR